jgi:16S rRNA (guanine966-N2)-methyltransferase
MSKQKLSSKATEGAAKTRPSVRKSSKQKGSPSAPILNAPGKIRIVGGLWKRTPIIVTDAPGLRPTPDRVREALFNWLGPSIKASVCLDLFAGSGALGLEALSRGAAHVHFNEPHLKASRQISELLERLQKPSESTWEVSALDAHAALSRQSPNYFDLVFLDPPFQNQWLEKIIPALLPVLKNNARLYIEAESAFQHPALQLLRADQAGQVHYHLFKLREA